MTPTTLSVPDTAELRPEAALRQWAVAERQFAGWPKLHWSDSTEGAPLVDLVPNPKRYLVGEYLGAKLAMDCGEPGIGIRK
jgi:hypothetical protein